MTTPIIAIVAFLAGVIFLTVCLAVLSGVISKPRKYFDLMAERKKIDKKLTESKAMIERLKKEFNLQLEER